MGPLLLAILAAAPSSFTPGLRVSWQAEVKEGSGDLRIDRAGDLWAKHWPDQPDDVYTAMRAVTSIMRAQQILIAELDALLRPYGITFSRFEALVLLTFSQRGSLPLSKIGERLQVHATSVTNVIDRLEAAGLVRREPNPRDGRGTLARGRGRSTARPRRQPTHAGGFSGRRARCGHRPAQLDAASPAQPDLML